MGQGGEGKGTKKALRHVKHVDKCHTRNVIIMCCNHGLIKIKIKANKQKMGIRTKPRTRLSEEQ